MNASDYRILVETCLARASENFESRLSKIFDEKYDDAGIHLSIYGKQLAPDTKALLVLMLARYEIMIEVITEMLVNLKNEGFY